MLVASYVKKQRTFTTLFFSPSLLEQLHTRLCMLAAGVVVWRGPQLVSCAVNLGLLCTTVKLLKPGYVFGYRASSKLFLAPVRMPTQLFFMLNMSNTWSAVGRAPLSMLLAWALPVV